jgi:hypothetical protein
MSGQVSIERNDTESQSLEIVLPKDSAGRRVETEHFPPRPSEYAATLVGNGNVWGTVDRRAPKFLPCCNIQRDNVSTQSGEEGICWFRHCAPPRARMGRAWCVVKWLLTPERPWLAKRRVL